MLLQVLDDGRITDSKGRVVDFKNTIIILTSNLGSTILLEGIGSDMEITEKARAEVDQLLKRSFRPEFLNRLDEIVFFKPLSRDNISQIVELMIDKLNKRLDDRQLKCVLTDNAKKYIIDNGYDPVYGARPLRRFIQKYVETLIGREMIANEPLPGTTITVDAAGGDLILK